jgi:AraC family transcriptional regulator, regulatory protein of adaptative response / DNA-3-methyladenine glycosylase II
MAVSERHLNRLLTTTVGAGPLALARARRAHTARILIETTALPFSEVAFAAGFASIRQFNDTIRVAFGASPTVLRTSRGRDLTRNRAGAAAGPTPTGALSLRLPARRPFDGPRVLEFLGTRAVPGIEEVSPSGGYRRVLDLAHGPAVVALRPTDDHVEATLRLSDLRDLTAAVERCRRLLDLDADPFAIDDRLGADVHLGPLVAARPGLRAPGSVDGAELAVRAVIGQQVSVTGARTIAGRLTSAFGKPLASPDGGLTHCFPVPEALADADPSAFPMPRSRALAIKGLAATLADGRLTLDPGADREEVRRRLVEQPGIGPWTADYVALRALGDPDSFLPTDLGVRRALEQLGQPGDPASAVELATDWRPWRSYALHHLWASLAHPPGTVRDPAASDDPASRGTPGRPTARARRR